MDLVGDFLDSCQVNYCRVFLKHQHINITATNDVEIFVDTNSGCTSQGFGVVVRSRSCFPNMGQQRC